MYKRLKRRFIVIAMISFTIVIFILGMAINLSLNAALNYSMDEFADYILQNDGEFPYTVLPQRLPFGIKMTGESRFETRYFSVVYENNSKIINLDNISNISLEEAQEYSDEILERPDGHGYISHFRYAKHTELDKIIIIFVNSSLILSIISSIGMVVIIAGIFCLLLLFLIVSLLADKAVQPYINNMELQKRFITDASHEIKTPLSVISANVEVMEMMSGENELTQSTVAQVKRLNILVNKLITLAKTEEIRFDKENMHDVDLSEIVKKKCFEFKILAEKNNNHIVSRIHDGIILKGNREKLEQLISLLIENSCKYAPENSEIKVNLSKSKRHINISVANECVDVEKVQIDHLFDRFYRADSSHNSKTGGQGVGLSIARAIVEAHNGKINAQLFSREKKDFIMFNVRL